MCTGATRSRHKLKTPSLRILDAALGLLADIDSYGELYFTRKLVEPGDFAFSMPLAAEGASALTAGTFILAGDGGKRIGIIEETERKVLGQGTEWIIARGHEAKGMFARRIVLPPVGSSRLELSAPAETVMKALVGGQCGIASEEARRFPGVSIEEDQGRGSGYALSCGYSNLLLELCSCEKATGTGFTLHFDATERKLVFDIIVGMDRSAGQDANARALFAQEYDTFKSAILSLGFLGFCSALYVLGSKLSEGRPMALAWRGLEPQGYGRFERALDALALDTSESLHEYGVARLGSFPMTFFLEAELPCNSPLVLDQDYFLGDLCSVKAYRQWYTVPIESIEERWTKDGPGIRVGFGRPAKGAFSTALAETNELREALRSG